MKTKIYWRVRPDRRNGSDDFVYFQIHIKFGPLDSEQIYYSRSNDDPHGKYYDSRYPVDKKLTPTYKEIWKTWKHIEIDFDPLRVVRMNEGKSIERTWWAFDVEFDMPEFLRDSHEANCKIKSIKQSNLPHRKLIPEDNDDGLHTRNLMLIRSKDDEFMP